MAAFRMEKFIVADYTAVIRQGSDASFCSHNPAVRCYRWIWLVGILPS
jgi:hypothetical protein